MTENDTPTEGSNDPTKPAPETVPAVTPPAANPSFAHLPPPPGTPATSLLPLNIGDIVVTADTVITPNGSAPLAGSHWTVVDRSITETKTPTSAIVLAIIFFFVCLIGLLFLLSKETTVSGFVEVTVISGSLSHMTQIPVSSQDDIVKARALVSQAQSLAASAKSAD